LPLVIYETHLTFRDEQLICIFATTIAAAVHVCPSENFAVVLATFKGTLRAQGKLQKLEENSF
jgi:hypothetical protein